MDALDKQKREVCKACVQRRQNIDALMNELRGKLDRHAGREDLTWASVGSLAHVEELLREITEFMN